jgi:hypothetical protein
MILEGSCGLVKSEPSQTQLTNYSACNKVSSGMTGRALGGGSGRTEWDGAEARLIGVCPCPGPTLSTQPVTGLDTHEHDR